MREKEGKIFLFDSGDLLFKRYSNPIPEGDLKILREKAQLIIESFNLMGYDAVGVGEDDLTLGKEFLIELSKKANFPFLSSNLLDAETKKPIFQPYLMKERNGLKIGIFSLISPECFSGPTDPRLKGMVIQNPTKVGREMIKELQTKADLIVLLSHLGYSKDVEFAQANSDVRLIFGGHTGTHLLYAPVIHHTAIFQTAPKGMYAAKLSLTLYSSEPSIVNSWQRRSLESSLQSIKNKLSSPNLSESEKAQWRKAQEEMERNLKKFQGKNEFVNTFLPLNEMIRSHPEILKMIEGFKSKFSTVENPLSPK
ncbi:MAG: hypothetical protein ACPL6D_16525 [Thermodesulfobacteriota bacterium]